ncbi:HAMP domain-containing histidine kinase [Zavarzinia compransoris]|uniref:sensor histidine kinase n=1 Tax=Zavarzinia marina TaxID=2911065 RepID=UPI001F295DB7|nr:HAMP domain-containing sensor histidine kinase [Zavarzinia marina]MCF4165549.1 HAMP domain-containing histidine kinase [Zavarzinia marina]
MSAAPPRSLLRAILRALIVANLIALVGISAGFIISGLADHDNQVDEGLVELASDLADAVHADAAGHIVLDTAEDDWAERLASIPDLRYVVYDPDGDRLTPGSSVDLRAALGDSWLRDWRESRFTLTPPGGDNVHGVMLTVSVEGRPVRIAVARSDHYWPDLARWVFGELGGEILPAAVPALAVSMIFAWIAMRRAMAPVAAATARLAVLDPTGGGDRLDPAAVPGEVAPLVAAVNDAFDRVAAAFAHERRFVADAAHELKTPIAVLRARLDGLADREIAARLGADVERLGRIVERLLTSARLDQAQAPLVALDLVALARDVVAEGAPLALARGRELDFRAPEGAVATNGDAAALAEALRNLIDNAVRHAAPGTMVEIEVAAEAGGGAAIEVRDRGPGLPPGPAGQLFAPFVSTAPSGGGNAGLGLAIVATVARRHGGRVEACDRDGGGALFRLVLPPRSA